MKHEAKQPRGKGMNFTPPRQWTVSIAVFCQCYLANPQGDNTCSRVKCHAMCCPTG
jgi:hypothetical protein